jgi:ribosomal subunit interface protein
MEVTITARHCTVPPATRRAALLRLNRLQRFEPRGATAIVNFESDHGEKHVEARLSVHGRPAVIARGSGPNFRVALDRSVEKLERQLRRNRARIRNHRAVPRSERAEAIPR